jgi:hypothetical protein
MVDHLVYAVPDLQAGTEAIEARLAATPSPGGSHESWGTSNVLLGLGGRRYLEVVAPDATLAPPAAPRPFGLDGVVTPALAAWCVEPPDLDAAVAAVRAVGYGISDPMEMSRRTPGGELLTWRLALPVSPEPPAEVVPFLIDWGSTPHPGASAPSTVTLVGLSAEHPDPSSVRPVIEALGIDLTVVDGPAPALVAVFQTEAGRVELR